MNAATKLFMGLALIVAGVILLVYGAGSADSLSSSFSEFFTGKPTDKTVWLIAGGAALTVAGLGLALTARGRTA